MIFFRGNSAFGRGTNPGDLWGPQNAHHLEASNAPVKNTDVGIEVTGAEVFGDIFVGEEIPYVEILTIEPNPEDRGGGIIVEYSVDGESQRVRVTRELVSPEVIEANPGLRNKFMELIKQLKQEGQYDFAERVEKLIRQATEK